jgi:phage-related minor tail protein
MFSCMSENVQTAMYEILKKIQADIASFRTDVNERFTRVEARFEGLEDLVRKQRRDTAGLLVMAKAVTGDFAEQVAAIEERVRVLEARGR